MSQSKILLVDDDASLLRLLSMRLKAAGFTVVTAASGRQALARLPTFQPQVIITDLRMEGMDGLALFNEVHSRYPSLPVIILTAHGTIPDAVDATRKGVQLFNQALRQPAIAGKHRRRAAPRRTTDG